MKYRIVESVEKKENINHPVDDNFTLSKELLNIKSEKINESVETENSKKSINESSDGSVWNNIVDDLLKRGYDISSEDEYRIWADTPEEAKSAASHIAEYYSQNYRRGDFDNMFDFYGGGCAFEVNPYFLGINESLEEDYEYSDYDKKLLVNRAKSIAKAISDLYNSNQVEAQGELPSVNEIAKALLDSPKKIDMYAKFLSKMKATKKAESLIEKLVKELMNFKKKLSMVKKPQTSECLMKVRDIKEGKEIDRQVFASLEKLNDGGYTILNDGYFVARVSADDDDDAKAVFKKFLNSDWKKAWKDGTLPKYANDWLEGNVNESLGRVIEAMRSEYAMDDSQMSEWNDICKAFAKKVGAKLVFVNETSCGIEFPDGSMKHIYIDEMVDYLSGMNESVNEDVFHEWKPNTSFNHIKKVMSDVENRGFKAVNNEREELKAAMDKADKKGYTPEQRRMLRDWYEKYWKANRNKQESFKRVPERSINESKVSNKGNNNG